VLGRSQQPSRSSASTNRASSTSISSYTGDPDPDPCIISNFLLSLTRICRLAGAPSDRRAHTGRARQPRMAGSVSRLGSRRGETNTKSRPNQPTSTNNILRHNPKSQPTPEQPTSATQGRDSEKQHNTDQTDAKYHIYFNIRIVLELLLPRFPCTTQDVQYSSPSIPS